MFICEQKLYTRTQLQQHRRSGDSEVDGTEEERSGFMGHPMCDFCKSHFYGDNELYMHMSTEHYTCHICQRYSVLLFCSALRFLSQAEESWFSYYEPVPELLCNS